MRVRLSVTFLALMTLPLMAGCEDQSKRPDSLPSPGAVASTSEGVSSTAVLPLSPAERTVMLDAVREQLSTPAFANSSVESANVVVTRGKGYNPYLGAECDSGRLFNVQLIGNFPRIWQLPIFGLGGVRPGTSAKSVVLTTDYKDGEVCGFGVQQDDVVVQRRGRAFDLP